MPDTVRNGERRVPVGSARRGINAVLPPWCTVRHAPDCSLAGAWKPARISIPCGYPTAAVPQLPDFEAGDGGSTETRVRIPSGTPATFQEINQLRSGLVRAHPSISGYKGHKEGTRDGPGIGTVLPRWSRPLASRCACPAGLQPAQRSTILPSAIRNITMAACSAGSPSGSLRRRVRLSKGACRRTEPREGGGSWETFGNVSSLRRRHGYASREPTKRMISRAISDGRSSGRKCPPGSSRSSAPSSSASGRATVSTGWNRS
jgi:hypothetical protein